MKAMVLAAGRGERMGDLTLNKPKPLLEIAGKPLLAHHLERLKAAGFTEIVINTSYLGEQICQFVGDGSPWGLSITCTLEEQRLETAGGIFNALPLLGSDPFLVINGDVWIDYPLAQLQRSMAGFQPCGQTLGRMSEPVAHLVMVDNPAHNPQGDFVLQEDWVTAEGEHKLTFSGLSVISPALFEFCKPGRAPLAPLLRDYMSRQRVTGEYYSGNWIDVGTPHRLQQLAELLSGI